jgi:hypothetical protein
MNFKFSIACAIIVGVLLLQSPYNPHELAANTGYYKLSIKPPIIGKYEKNHGKKERYCFKIN